jgi:hypothetical protein
MTRCQATEGCLHRRRFRRALDVIAEAEQCGFSGCIFSATNPLPPTVCLEIEPEESTRIELLSHPW